MKFLSKLITTSLAVMLVAYLMPGVRVDSILIALLVAAVLAFLNAIIKPVLVFLTLPVTLLTLGLFLLVINALMILFADYLIDGFEVRGFWTAFFFSIILSMVNTILEAVTKTNKVQD